MPGTNSPITSEDQGRYRGRGRTAFFLSCRENFMPLGTTHQISGTVARGPWGYVLHVGNGGVWELDCGLFTRLRLRAAHARAVRVEGERVGFNALAARRVVVLD